MFVYVHMCEGTHGGQKRAKIPWHWDPSGVTEGCESRDMGAENHTLVFCKSNKFL